MTEIDQVLDDMAAAWVSSTTFWDDNLVADGRLFLKVRGGWYEINVKEAFTRRCPCCGERFPTVSMVRQSNLEQVWCLSCSKRVEQNRTHGGARE